MLDFSKPRNFGLDILRAGAILLVFIEHLDWGIFNNLKPNSLFGILGVELFFVLSGFLIGGIVFKLNLKQNRPSLTKFYLNRWFRTLPLYYCGFIAFQLIDAVHYQKLQIHWPYLVFLQNMFPDPHGFFAVSWSLAIEEWFYLILPWLIYLIFRFRFTKNHLLLSLCSLVFVLICLRAIYTGYFNPSFDPDIRKSILFHFDPLLIGVILALVKKEQLSLFVILKNINLLLLSIISLIIFALYFSHLDLTSNINDSYLIKTIGLTWIAISMAIIIGFFEQNIFIKQKLVGYKLLFSLMTAISLLSYSIYIWHYEVNKIIYFITHLLIKTDFPQAILSIVFTGIVAYISYSWIETPFLKLRKKING
jgi:peptidoglycan/LPS O-acetylase OafA/YrhL